MQPAATDVCIIVEGAFPYVSGGVSVWVKDLILAHPDLEFQVVCLMPDRNPRKMRYPLPGNAVGLHHIYLQELEPGARLFGKTGPLFELLGPSLRSLEKGGDLQVLGSIIEHLRPYKGQLGRRALLDSEAAFATIVRMYEASNPQDSFLHYFWAWRALFGGLFATLVAELPPARVYHTVSTGYAGLLAARAKLETGRPVLLTEHGIYTNERRIEILMADWLFDDIETGYSIDRYHRTLRDLWVEMFQRYAYLCYQASDHIITLYEGNQHLQVQGGAAGDKMQIVPNGIDVECFAAVARQTDHRRPTIALIGRVVPIKDVKTYLRAVSLLRPAFPGLRALIMGPSDEDDEYYEECQALARNLELGATVEFTGRVDVLEYLGQIDVVVLTSISEAQPLVILEAGAAGIPIVATDVGACRELIYGRSDENPLLGTGGAVTPVASPQETAAQIRRLLLDADMRYHCGRRLRERVRRYYNKKDIDKLYGNLYRELAVQPDASHLAVGVH